MFQGSGHSISLPEFKEHFWATLSAHGGILGLAYTGPGVGFDDLCESQDILWFCSVSALPTSIPCATACTVASDVHALF